MGRRTPLYDTHIQHGARMVDFAGWDMPLHYGSQLLEHRCVREQAGLFDVSHMTTVDVSGSGFIAAFFYGIININYLIKELI